jgi:hypothetical protein
MSTTTTAATVATTTESRHGRRVRRRRPWGRPGPVGTALIAWVTFLVVFVFLSVQLRQGNDPVLGAQAPPAKNPVVHRRLERRVVLTRVVPAPSTGASASSAPAPVVSAPAPVTSAPAPAPPAPAPAPVTTQSS